MRAASVPTLGTDYEFKSAMPFCMEAEKATERLRARRAASVEAIVRPKPFSYAEHYSTNCTPGDGYSAFDYKVGFLPIYIHCKTPSGGSGSYLGLPIPVPEAPS